MERPVRGVQAAPARSQPDPRYERTEAGGNRFHPKRTSSSMIWRPKSAGGAGGGSGGEVNKTLRIQASAARSQNPSGDGVGTSGGRVFPSKAASSTMWKPKTGGAAGISSGGREKAPPIQAAARSQNPHYHRARSSANRNFPKGMASYSKWNSRPGGGGSVDCGETNAFLEKGKGKGKGKPRRRKGSSRKGKLGPGEKRNWAEMPQDALSVIFEKLGPIYVLYSAEAVCRSWRQVAHDSRIWRIVDFRKGVWDMYDCEECDLTKMGPAAVDRSNGQLEEFYIEHFGSDEILIYMAERSAKLRCLRLVSCYDISDEGLTEAAKRLPLLEELDISYCSVSEEIFETIGKSCPQLKSFHLNTHGCKLLDMEGDDEAAFAIAKSMPMLRELQLFGNQLTNEGLLAILDSCPHLESLDLRQCFNVNLDEALKTKCTRIKNLRLPYDSTADYPFNAEIAGFGPDPFDSDDDFGDYYEYDYDSDSFVYDDFCAVDYDALFSEDGISMFFAAAHMFHGDHDLSD